MPFPDPDRQKTLAAISDPQPGDVFTEMYAFWLYVVKRDGNTIVTMEANPPCTFPDDGIVKIQTLEQFQARLAYSSDYRKGVWVRLCGRARNVSGWV